MSADAFSRRLAEVRERFGAKLETRIAEIEAMLPDLVRESPTLAKAMTDVHRRVHDLCGIGPTLGFVETGKAARAVERLMLAASRAARPLDRDQFAEVSAGLAALRTAALTEIKSMHGVE